MIESAIKEELSEVYLSAICAVEGISCDIQRHDDDSTDVIIKKLLDLDDGRKFESSVRIQLKSTSSANRYRESSEKITYDLRVKNYNDLRCDGTTPIVLALLVLPEDKSEWVSWSKEELALRGRMYWKNLHGEPETNNLSTISIDISKDNYINSDTLIEILKNIAMEVFE